MAHTDNEDELLQAWEWMQNMVENHGAEPVFIYNHASDSGWLSKSKLPKHHRARRRLRPSTPDAREG